MALLVIFSHSFVLSGHISEPLVAESGDQVSLGFVAVLGFFGLSGWLLVGSRQRTRTPAFLRNRALRIFPAYWVALMFGALVSLAQGATLDAAVGYVASNLTILMPGEHTIAPAFGGAAVNGALWTLGPELWCYVALALTPVRWLRPMTVGLGISFVVGWYVIGGFEVLLFVAFATGAAARLFAIPTRWWSVLAAVVAFRLHLTPLACASVAFAALSLMHLPFRMRRDLSYGTYVFAYPVMLALPVVNTWLATAMTVAVVLPMAWASWTFIEAPAIRLSRHGHRLAARPST